MMHTTCRRSSVRALSQVTRPSQHVVRRNHNRNHVRSSSNLTNHDDQDKHTLSHSATDYFAALRWKAAETLTSILSKEERQDLWKKLDGVTAHDTKQNNNKNEPDAAVATPDTTTPTEVTSKTIGEAVIAARAEEARKQEAKWEKEKDLLLQQAEQAAMERVESDIVIQQRRLALERWQRDVEREKQQEQETEASAVPALETDDHPLLGQAVVDLGYKRVYMVSARTLSAIPVWKKQRIYRHDRAKIMASDKAKTPHLGLPGIIALHEDTDGRLSILDGQHRVGMMTILEEKSKDGNHGIDLDHVLVEVYSTDRSNHKAKADAPSSNDPTKNLAQDLFTEINKAEPVKLVDMPGVATKTDRKVITEGAAKLQEAFPDMFKASQKCRAPHLNVDNLRDALFASDVIKKHNIKTPKRLVEWMMEQNQVLKLKFQDEEVNKNTSQVALKKAVEYEFYLGLESSWLYN